MHEALKILSEYRDFVWDEIKPYLSDPLYPKQFPVPDKYKKEHEYYWQMVCDYPERKGKYLRPTLVLLACEALGGTINLARKTAAAMQLSEEWMLLDDDIMDNSTLRRGKPTHHRLYGIEQSVVIGDVLQSITYKALIDNEKMLGSEKTLKIIDEMHRIIMRTAQGQSFEAMWTKNKNFDLSEEDCFFMIDSKTSYYSIGGPLRLGAIVADASEKQLDLLSEFGIYLGRCFQLVDDMLGVTSDFDGKKQAGGDIYEGKVTILVAHLMKTLSEKDKKIVIDILTTPMDEKTDDQVQTVVKLMKDMGSIDYCKKLADQYKEKAYNMFENDLDFLAKSEAGEKLKIVADFALNRTH